MSDDFFSKVKDLANSIADSAKSTITNSVAASPATKPPHVQPTRTGSDGQALIKQSESCRLVAYADPASPRGKELQKHLADRVAGWQTLSGAPWTCGWGQTSPEIVEGTIWTQAQADTRFVASLTSYEKQVSDLVKVPISQKMYDALVDFCYNEGSGNLAKSQLLKNLNAGQYAATAPEFDHWDIAGGQHMAGLHARRLKEHQLFVDGMKDF